MSSSTVPHPKRKLKKCVSTNSDDSDGGMSKEKKEETKAGGQSRKKFHADYDYAKDVQIRKSTIRNAGDGVFL